MRKTYLLITFFNLSLFTTLAQNKSPLTTTDAQAQQQWVNDTYNKMSLDEKIGQLFMVSVFSSHIGTKKAEEVKDFILHLFVSQTMMTLLQTR